MSRSKGGILSSDGDSILQSICRRLSLCLADEDCVMDSSGGCTKTEST